MLDSDTEDFRVHLATGNRNSVCSQVTMRVQCKRKAYIEYLWSENEEASASSCLNVVTALHLTILISALWNATSFSFLTGQVSLPCNILLHTQLLYNLPLTVNDMSLLVSNGTNCLNFYWTINRCSSSDDRECPYCKPFQMVFLYNKMGVTHHVTPVRQWLWSFLCILVGHVQC